MTRQGVLVARRTVSSVRMLLTLPAVLSACACLYPTKVPVLLLALASAQGCSQIAWTASNGLRLGWVLHAFRHLLDLKLRHLLVLSLSLAAILLQIRCLPYSANSLL